MTAREILDKGAEQIERGLKEEPLIRARMMHTMGRTYMNLGLLDAARPLLERALLIREENTQASASDVADSLLDLGFLEHANLVKDVAFGYRHTGLPLGYGERALALLRDHFDSDPLDVARSLVFVADCEWKLELLEPAEEHAREALAILEQHPHASLWRTGTAMTVLSIILLRQEKIDEAVELALETVELFDRAMEQEQYWPPTEDPVYEAAWTLREVGRAEEAWPLFERSLQHRERVFGASSYHVQNALSNMAKLKRDLGRFEEALDLLERADAIVPRDTHLGDMICMSELLLGLGEIEKAYEYRKRIMEAHEADPDWARDPAVLSGRLHLAHLLFRLGRVDEARGHYRRAIELFTDGVETLDRESMLAIEAIHELAVLVAEQGHNEDALLLFEIAVRHARECEIITRRHELQAAIHRDWAELLSEMGRGTEAAEHEALAAELVAMAPIASGT